MIKILELTYCNAKKIANLKDFFTVSFTLIDYVYSRMITDFINNR